MTVNEKSYSMTPYCETSLVIVQAPSMAQLLQPVGMRRE